MKDKRISILVIALLLAVCATLTTQISKRIVIIAQSSQPTYASSTRASKYFVAPDGNDSNPGTEALPWRTIQKAANTLVAGDTVYIKNGTYYERVLPARSGTSNNYIIYSAYPGHSPIIHGSGVSSGYKGLFEVQTKSYIIISGLTVRDSKAAAIYVRKSNDIIIRDNNTEESVSTRLK